MGPKILLNTSYRPPASSRTVRIREAKAKISAGQEMLAEGVAEMEAVGAEMEAVAGVGEVLSKDSGSNEQTVSIKPKVAKAKKGSPQ